ncbi:DUF1501 domain-containing protein [soil metagenome]
MTIHPISRRGFLQGSGTLVAWAFTPRIASAAPSRDPRFVAIVLRGALDGLAAVAPVGDPDYLRVRNGLVVPTSGDGAGIPLDGFFVLNPAMPVLAELYRKGEALIVHAAASPYRERSHFDGQDVLESGQTGAGLTDTGWLNRALMKMPKGEPLTSRDVLALGSGIPLIVRGRAPVVTLTPEGFAQPPDDTRARLLDLYNHTNPMLAAQLERAVALAGEIGPDGAMGAGDMSGMTALPAAARPYRLAGETAGRLLAKPDGPRIGAIGLFGWDTHQAEGPLGGRLGTLLGALDQSIDGLRSALGDAWKDTVAVIATEFGRTARMNGTEGTDHGTATVAILVGGAVKGGRVIADWPGLSDAALYQQRDLKPTTDLRSVFKGVLRDHVGVPENALAREVFPQSAAAKPMDGLIA